VEKLKEKRIEVRWRGNHGKTFWMGLILAIYGAIVLIGAVVACPAKHASISVSLFMILTGMCFAILGKDMEKKAEAK